MIRPIIESQHFTAQAYTTQPFPVAEYEDCCFTNCQLAGADLSDSAFVECRFEGCDLSNAKLHGTAFKSVRFKDCKLLGLQFDHCSPFLLEMQFEGCNLSLAVFYQLNLKGTRFQDCNLQEADFMEADLTNAVFDRCDLHRATFDSTKLGAADLRSAIGFSIDPERNLLKKAKFSSLNIAGLLDKYGIIIESLSEDLV